MQKPLVGAAALWIVCYPLVFFLYDDLFISASTLAGMTIWFLAFLFAIICIMVAIGFAVAFLFEVIGKRRKASSR